MGIGGQSDDKEVLRVISFKTNVCRRGVGKPEDADILSDTIDAGDVHILLLFLGLFLFELI